MSVTVRVIRFRPSPPPFLFRINTFFPASRPLYRRAAVGMDARRETSVHWFRKGMRVHDNPAFKLSYETKTGGGERYGLRPVYVLDPHFRKHVRAGPNRWRFLQQCLADLDATLRKLGTRLYVVRGVPDVVFPDLFAKWNVKLLTYETDTEPYARGRDEQVERLASQHGVSVKRAVSHTIYDTESVLRANGGRAPMTYQKFVSVVGSMPAPRRPIPAPDALPAECLLADDANNDGEYDVPTLDELLTLKGFGAGDLKPCLYPGGETEALRRLDERTANKTWVCKFEKPNTSPNSLKPSTTVLSPYMKFGCLSANRFYYRLKEVIGNSPHSKPPVSLIGQLYWREFYYTVAAATPNFDRMVGNPICCQVPWDDNPDALVAWTNGRTGYPFIDAIMRQLRDEGWIHHLARHAVACFLTRGDLWISWESGMAVFEEFLLDADWSMNAGNWLWLSASAFFHQFYRVYSPVAFGKKTDKNGDYIRKYVPELAKYPDRYIYEPWLAPKACQERAGCVVGVHYPNRVVVHENVYKENIARMSLAYKSAKVGKSSGGNSSKNSSSPVKKRRRKS